MLMSEAEARAELIRVQTAPPPSERMWTMSIEERWALIRLHAVGLQQSLGDESRVVYHTERISDLARSIEKDKKAEAK